MLPKYDDTWYANSNKDVTHRYEPQASERSQGTMLPSSCCSQDARENEATKARDDGMKGQETTCIQRGKDTCAGNQEVPSAGRCSISREKHNATEPVAVYFRGNVAPEEDLAPERYKNVIRKRAFENQVGGKLL